MVGQTLDDRTLSILMKVLSVLSGSGIAILGIMDFVFFSSRISNPIDFMLAIYFILFGVTGILCEFPIPRFSFYFSFLKKYFGKGLYFVFISTISMDFSVWWRILIFVVAIGTGIVYIIFAFTVLFRKVRGKLQEENEAPAPAADNNAEAPKNQA